MLIPLTLFYNFPHAKMKNVCVLLPWSCCCCCRRDYCFDPRGSLGRLLIADHVMTVFRRADRGERTPLYSWIEVRKMASAWWFRSSCPSQRSRAHDRCRDAANGTKAARDGDCPRHDAYRRAHIDREYPYSEHFWERRGGAAWATLNAVAAVGVRTSAARKSIDLRRGRCLSRVDRQREGAEDALRGCCGWMCESHVHIASRSYCHASDERQRNQRR